jgi:hypothetical protein
MAAVQFLAFLIAVGLSIPAAALFGFAQVVGDVRIIGNNVVADDAAPPETGGFRRERCLA